MSTTSIIALILSHTIYSHKAITIYTQECLFTKTKDTSIINVWGSSEMNVVKKFHYVKCEKTFPLSRMLEPCQNAWASFHCSDLAWYHQ